MPVYQEMHDTITTLVFTIRWAFLHFSSSGKNLGSVERSRVAVFSSDPQSELAFQTQAS